jgi:phosphoserine aminotransferase
MSKRVYNFNPGPSALPLEVLNIVREELLDYKGTGMSILESSHRGKEYEEINNSAMSLVKEILGLGDNYKVLFLTGGASMQFAMVPMNFVPEGKVGAYVDTGSWANKAIKECNAVAKAQVLFSAKADGYKRIPKLSELSYPENAAYVHITSNNTIEGCQWQEFPNTGKIPLICDMSSDIASRPADYNRFALIYAGAQKNLGPAGVTLVIIREDFLATCKSTLPVILNYQTYANESSLYNTPPAFAVYVTKLVLEWIKRQGGLTAIEKVNKAKKDYVYGMVDKYPDFFRGPVEQASRSWMNLTFRLPDEELEKKFIAEAKAAGFVGLKGHRSVGGIRASLYNAVPLEGAQKLAEFMENFRSANKK